MAKDITKPGANALSTDVVGKLIAGIGESRQSTVIPGGKPLLRLLKDGGWVYGQKDDAVQEGSSWAINPLSIMHGWCAWTAHEGNTKNTLVGEVMLPVYQPKPDRPPPTDGWPYNEQRTMDLRCMDGDDEGIEAVYKNASIGGMRAFDELLAKLQAKLADDPSHPCPVVQLLSDDYQHPKWGRIYVPIFNIVDWATMDGQLASEAGGGRQPEPEPEPEPAPRRAVRQAAPARQPAPEEPAPTARGRGKPEATPTRRRPLRR